MLRYIDKRIFISLVLLSITSLITIYGVTPQLLNYGSVGNSFIFLIKQLIGFVIGFGIFFVILKTNIFKFYKYINIFNLILIGMFVILFLDPPIIGDIFVQQINGAKGWFKIPIIGVIQPVEFFKITMILKLAEINYQYKNSNRDDKFLVKSYLFYGVIPTVLVLLQPDLGGAILLGVPLVALFYVGLKDNKYKKIIGKSLLVLFIVVLLFIFFPLIQDLIVSFTPIKEYQLERINAWLYPFEYDSGFQLQQSLILIGSSGPFGYGMGNVPILLPEPHTDFIFSQVIGMFGWVSGFIVILIYGNLLYSINKMAIDNNNTLVKYIMLGYLFLFFVQIVENIGMIIGVLPITGIVLPFLSYGVSSLTTYFIIIGIILNLNHKIS